MISVLCLGFWTSVRWFGATNKGRLNAPRYSRRVNVSAVFAAALGLSLEHLDLGSKGLSALSCGLELDFVGVLRHCSEAQL